MATPPPFCRFKQYFSNTSEVALPPLLRSGGSRRNTRRPSNAPLSCLIACVGKVSILLLGLRSSTLARPFLTDLSLNYLSTFPNPSFVVFLSFPPVNETKYKVVLSLKFRRSSDLSRFHPEPLHCRPFSSFVCESAAISLSRLSNHPSIPRECEVFPTNDLPPTMSAPNMKSPSRWKRVQRLLVPQNTGSACPLRFPLRLMV